MHSGAGTCGPTSHTDPFAYLRHNNCIVLCIIEHHTVGGGMLKTNRGEACYVRNVSIFTNLLDPHQHGSIRSLGPPIF